MAAKRKQVTKDQSARFLEAAKAAGVTDKSFQRAMGKITLAKQGRKPKG